MIVRALRAVSVAGIACGKNRLLRTRREGSGGHLWVADEHELARICSPLHFIVRSFLDAKKIKSFVGSGRSFTTHRGVGGGRLWAAVAHLALDAK